MPKRCPAELSALCSHPRLLQRLLPCANTVASMQQADLTTLSFWMALFLDGTLNAEAMHCRAVGLVQPSRLLQRLLPCTNTVASMQQADFDNALHCLCRPTELSALCSYPRLLQRLLPRANTVASMQQADLTTLSFWMALSMPRRCPAELSALCSHPRLLQTTFSEPAALIKS